MNRKQLFHGEGDYEQFESILMEYKSRYGISIYHYCYMTNHVHLLIYSEDVESMSKFSQYVQRRYAYYYCSKHKWNGSVFGERYKSHRIDKESYLLECGRYIERNPVKAKMAKKPEQYYYSSYHYYVVGRGSRLITPSPAYRGLGRNDKQRRELYKRHVNEVRIQEEMVERGILPKED